MSFLGGSGGSQQQPVQYIGIPVNTSVNYLPIPIVLGWGRIAPNLIGYYSFTATPQQGGGGLSGGGQVTGYDYTCYPLLGLCEGPVSPTPTTGALVWVDSQLDNIGQVPFDLFGGYPYPTQEAWSYVASDSPGQALAYTRIAYIGVTNYDMGNSPQLPNFGVLVYGPLAFGSYNQPVVTINSGANTTQARAEYVTCGDADVALAVQAILTNVQWGVPGFPSSSIDVGWFSTGAAAEAGDGTWQTYARALGLGVSIVMDSSEPASSLLERIFEITNTGVYWGGTTLKAVPFGDGVVSAYGVTYLPNVTTVVIVGNADFIKGDAAGPDAAARIDPATVYNTWWLEYRDASNAFNLNKVSYKDDGLIAIAGAERLASTIQGHELTLTANAQLALSLVAKRQMYIRNTPVTFKLGSEFWWVEPMDLMVLNDADLGWSDYVVRVIAIDEEIGADGQGILSFQAEEFPLGVATAAAHNTQAVVNGMINLAYPAGPVNTPVILEPCTSLTGGAAELWIAASGGQGGEAAASWGGADVWVSTDEVNYENFGPTPGIARQGVLTASLAAHSGANPDNTNILKVNLNESGGQLISSTLAAASAGQTVCYVDGELIAFETATLTIITVPVSEEWTVPTSPGPYTISVNFAADFVADTSVVYTVGGAPLTKVSGTPTTGEYAEASGIYTFAGGDAAVGVTISYGHTAPGYNLTGLYRGLYGTAPGAHASGSQFARLDQAVFKYAIPAAYVGQTIYIKLVSFNGQRLGAELISDVTAIPYTIQGTGFSLQSSAVMSALLAGTNVTLGDAATTIVTSFALGKASAPMCGIVYLGDAAGVS